MLIKLSTLIPADSTGVYLARVFHTYQTKVASVGNFVKVSIRVTKPRCRIRKKKKLKSFIIRSRFPLFKPDRSVFFFNKNNGVLLKRRLSMRGRVVFGPAVYNIKRKKFLKSFVRVL